MDSDISAITQEWKELESCGFHCYVGKWVLYIYMYQYLLEINAHSMYQHDQSFKELVADFLSSIGFYVSELRKR